MPHNRQIDITAAAYKAWKESLTSVPFPEWLEGQKNMGLFWGA